MAKAEKKSGQPIVRTVDAGCGRARVMPSLTGSMCGVTAAAGNALLAYSAAKLSSDPAHALIARVALGQAPVGMVTVNNGKQIVIADSNRFDVPGAVSNLAVVDVSKALARQPALVGLIKSGTAPRQFALEPNGITLLVTNTQSAQVQAVDISHFAVTCRFPTAATAIGLHGRTVGRPAERVRQLNGSVNLSVVTYVT